VNPAVYSIAGDTLNGAVLPAKLHGEITLAGFGYVETEEDELRVYFDHDLSGAELGDLDAIVAAHDGIPAPGLSFRVPSKIVNDPKEITSDQTFVDLGGVVTTLGAFISDASKAVGRFVGSIKTQGAGAELDVVQDSDGSSILNAPYALPDTAGVWTPLSFSTEKPPHLYQETFMLMGRLNGASAASVRYTTLSLLEIV